jgi:hypothetical protein
MFDSFDSFSFGLGFLVCLGLSFFYFLYYEKCIDRNFREIIKEEDRRLHEHLKRLSESKEVSHD